MKLYPASAMRRAMKVLEVVWKAIAQEIKWIQAADILGVTPRTIRRMGAAYQEQGIGGLADRHSVYWFTEKAGGKVDRQRLIPFGRAMEELGVEMIPGYSPQARGRSERWNGTWQGRLLAELRQAGIDNLGDANRYIAEGFLPEMNLQFTQEAAAEGSAFVSAAGADLDRIFAIRHEDRVVANDNTIRVNNLTLQIEKSRFRDHFVKCRVDVFEHLDSKYSIVWKKRVIGRYDSQG